ncbi:MAG TPA: hydroxyethylthiazole kinase [Clostridiales bacterium UBA8153]|nr:hydroxyethylthiazole kinase [Clostridiales bacterium UBA8153]
MDLAPVAAQLLLKVRQERPLVHNITNWVVTNVTANAALALGASPVMAHAQEEVEELASVSRALVLNIGTLTPAVLEAMMLAGRAANAAGRPVVLDPVGYGATALRTQATKSILKEVKVDVLRGNPAEIAGIGGLSASIKGVDSGATAHPGAVIARRVAADYRLVAAVTGATDYISDGRRLARVENGHPWLTLVTGTGCMATLAVAVFAAVEPDYLKAAACALACYGIAAELAAGTSLGPGTFGASLLDRLYLLQPEEVAQRARVTLYSGGSEEA